MISREVLAGRIGVCSWSLRPTGPAALVDSLKRLRIDRCQLALAPCVEDTATWRDAVEQLRNAGIEAVSGMFATIGEDYSTLDTIRKTGGIAPDEHWEANLDRAKRVADFAAARGITLVTFHPGFLPHDPADTRRAVLLERRETIARVFDDRPLRLGFETGQETPSTLLEALDDLKADNVGVNFDPANMILYGMGDPVAALRQLAPHVEQIHIKDATLTDTPGTWGDEVPVGEGAVDWKAFFKAVRHLKRPVDLVIEREAGDDREADIAQARDHVGQILRA